MQPPPSPFFTVKKFLQEALIVEFDEMYWAVDNVASLFRVKDQFTDINPSDVVLIEGILVFYHKDIREMFDMKLFVDTDADTRLARRGTRTQAYKSPE